MYLILLKTSKNRRNRDIEIELLLKGRLGSKKFASYEIPTEINTVENCTQNLPFRHFIFKFFFFFGLFAFRLVLFFLKSVTLKPGLY